MMATQGTPYTEEKKHDGNHIRRIVYLKSSSHQDIFYNDPIKTLTIHPYHCTCIIWEVAALQASKKMA
jgi:hypothetical protein